ncbi:Ser/Thr protein kinase RdoA (MazF antagonist) [Arcticibacter tournemirensis]|uniref:Aminoglycoside phosphotransferase family protein n=1 Tax=Arcticibacter tournemirensis TaxID=699437 RepID=A0A5M9HLF9_9SPHI|nr:aminoglycoside phosphotransferase family protein [Arcticibacter tournemirensis]KAA8485837.1 aminoglycoside phosphotransferase family protein [Arcticibacter tournemirensis]TQM46914.1 Ser/Thr protein kinase RdoA (MazF antagonist) [Arcticibacter tournemirensis]
MESQYNKEDVEGILSHFFIRGKVASITPFGSGHINSTFYVKNTDSNEPDYLLQKINHSVFKDVPGLIGNILLVTSHLKEKLKDVPGADPDKEVLTLVETKSGGFFTKDANGNYWRVYYFIKDTKSYDQVETPKQAFETGKAFGRFQKLLSDLDAEQLCHTIPNFHNIEMRLQQLHDAIDADPKGRVKEVEFIIDFINERAWQMGAVLRAGREGKLPLRIIHYDTKLNNVLLNKNDEVQCVIDLDTVMPGYVAYDFGDAIRTIINTSAEDEKQLDKINLNIPLFKAYTEGYFAEASGFLTENEIESLSHGMVLLPYMQTVRFLTDYIQGDTYYKIHFPGHNLQRSVAQMQLLNRIENEYDVLKGIIKDVAY